MFNLPSDRSLAASTVSIDLGASQTRSASTLIFIDATLNQTDRLRSSLPSNSEVIWLNPQGDAIDQITQSLQGRQGIESLHVFSHGSSGSLNFANPALTLATLPSRLTELRSWQSALTESADILLYGCDVASGATGEAFIQLLGQATGADIAASTDVTGLGGNWILERSTGSIETTAIAAWDYQDTLKVSDTQPINFPDRLEVPLGEPRALPVFNLTLDTNTPIVELVSQRGLLIIDPAWQSEGMIVETIPQGLRISGATIEEINRLVNTPGNITYLGELNYLGPDTITIMTRSSSNSSIDGLFNIAVDNVFNPALNTSEIIWRNEREGQIGMQLYNGLTYLTSQSIYYLTKDAAGLVSNVTSEWQIRAIEDFNGDQRDDILWQNTKTGDFGVWEMEGNLIKAWRQLFYFPSATDQGQAPPAQTIESIDPTWQIIGLGKTQATPESSYQDAFFWQNTVTGEMAVWARGSGYEITIPGTDRLTNVDGTAALPGAKWKAIQVQDFNNDSSSDILFENQETGELGIWYLQGDQIQSQKLINTLKPEEQLVNVGNLIPALPQLQVMYNAVSRDLSGLLMGLPPLASLLPESLPLESLTTLVQIPVTVPGLSNLGLPIAFEDFNDDGRQELIWYNDTTRQLSFWTLEISPISLLEFGLSSDLTKLVNAIKIDGVDPTIVNFPDIPANWSIAAIGNV